MKQGIKIKHYSQVFRILVTSFVCILFIPLGAIFLLNVYSLKVVEKETYSSYQSLAARTAEESTQIFNNAMRLNYKIATSQTMQRYNWANERDYMTEYEIRQKLMDYGISFDNMASCYYYLPQFDIIISENNVTSSRSFFERYCTGSYESWLQLLESAGKHSQISAMPETFDTENVCYLVMRRVSAASSNSSSAVAVTEIQTDYLKNHLRFTESLEQGIRIMLLTPFGTLSNTQNDCFLEAYQNQITQFKMDNTSFALLKSPSEAFDFQILYAVPMNLIKNSSHAIWKYFFVLFGESLAVTIVLGHYLVHKNYRPIQKICSLINRSVKSDLDNEYELIENTLQNYIAQNQTLKADYAKSSLRLQQLYLEKLLLNRIPNHSTIPDGLKLHNISFPYQIFALVLFQPDEGSVLFQDDALDNQERAELTQFIVNNIVTELFSEFCKVYPLELNEMPAVLCNLPSQSAAIRSQLSHATSDAIEAIRKHFQLNFTPFSSGFWSDLQNFPKMYAEAEASLTKKEQETDSQISQNGYAESVEQCIAIMKEHYADNNLSLTMIAETLSLNPSYISRYFKQQTGIGLLDYLQHYRLNAAKELIKSNPDILLKDVAEQTGFYNTAALIRVFKKIENITPGQYKANISQQNSC